MNSVDSERRVKSEGVKTEVQSDTNLYLSGPVCLSRSTGFMSAAAFRLVCGLTSASASKLVTVTKCDLAITCCTCACVCAQVTVKCLFELFFIPTQYIHRLLFISISGWFITNYCKERMEDLCTGLQCVCVCMCV